MIAMDRSPVPGVTRRRFIALTGLAALGALVLDAARKAAPALASAAPLVRPGAAGTSAARCAFCGSAAHSTLSPACAEGAAPRRSLQLEARRRAAGRAA